VAKLALTCRKNLQWWVLLFHACCCGSIAAWLRLKDPWLFFNTEQI
jgi:hypothetical protein